MGQPSNIATFCGDPGVNPITPPRYGEFLFQSGNRAGNSGGQFISRTENATGTDFLSPMRPQVFAFWCFVSFNRTPI